MDKHLKRLEIEKKLTSDIFSVLGHVPESDSNPETERVFSSDVWVDININYGYHNYRVKFDSLNISLPSREMNEMQQKIVAKLIRHKKKIVKLALAANKEISKLYL